MLVPKPSSFDDPIVLCLTYLFLELVIALDADPLRLRLAEHNAHQYGLSDKITFLLGTFESLATTLASTYEIDAIFFAPSWGGIRYRTEPGAKAADLIGKWTLRSPMPGPSLAKGDAEWSKTFSRPKVEGATIPSVESSEVSWRPATVEPSHRNNWFKPLKGEARSLVCMSSSWMTSNSFCRALFLIVSGLLSSCDLQSNPASTTIRKEDVLMVIYARSCMMKVSSGSSQHICCVHAS